MMPIEPPDQKFFEAARGFMRRMKDLNWRKIALDDIDLMPLWEALAGMFKHEA